MKFTGAHGARRTHGIAHTAGRFSALAAVAAVVALAGFAFSSGSAADDAANTQARFDANSVDSRAQAAVVEALMLYWTDGAAAFDAITPGEPVRDDFVYPFVLNATTLETVANGAYPDFAGVIPDALTAADRPLERIMADLERDGAAWAEYMASNPDTGLVQLKRSWLYLHDGYIFGSGHYLPESSVKHVVEDAVRLFESRGQGAFDIITPSETLLTAELYPFVFDAATLKTVAHGAIPDRVAHVPYSILNTGDKSVDEIMAELDRDGGTWVEYVFTNPATETKQLKRSWLYQYDGYIFISGYYVQDSRAQSLVDEATLLYAAHGVDAFDMITPETADALALQSSFALDGETLEAVAHGLLPDAVGTTDLHLTAADRSLERSGRKSKWINLAAARCQTAERSCTRPMRGASQSEDLHNPPIPAPLCRSNATKRSGPGPEGTRSSTAGTSSCRASARPRSRRRCSRPTTTPKR